MVYMNSVNSLLQKWKMQTKSNHGQICHYVAMRNSHNKKFKNEVNCFKKLRLKKLLCAFLFLRYSVIPANGMPVNSCIIFMLVFKYWLVDS